MKKSAILVDGEWFRIMLRKALPSPASGVSDAITADIFYRNALKAIDPRQEELFRLFCYDCEPFGKQQRNPVDQSWIRFGPGHPEYDSRMRFFAELSALPCVALRRGSVKGRGWQLRDDYQTRLLNSPAGTMAITPRDIKFGLEQKGVDMRIGMDVATLSLKRLVDRIVIISGDTDLVPAIKLARREGVQVIVTQVGNVRLSPELIEDADLLRPIIPA